MKKHIIISGIASALLFSIFVGCSSKPQDFTEVITTETQPHAIRIDDTTKGSDTTAWLQEQFNITTAQDTELETELETTQSVTESPAPITEVETERPVPKETEVTTQDPEIRPKQNVSVVVTPPKPEETVEIEAPKAEQESQENPVIVSLPKQEEKPKLETLGEDQTKSTESIKTEDSKSDINSTEIKITHDPSPVYRNEEVTLSAKGTPNADAKIKVYYSSGASKAKGLEDKKTDTDGNVSWTWKVGGKTNAGTYRITVDIGDESIEIPLIVSE